MTIKAFRLYFSCRDNATEIRINKSHWGVSYWINQKLKSIAPALKGPEVKGIDIANVWFADPGTARMPIGSWRRLLNALEYTFEFDTSALEQQTARTNLPRLIQMAAEASKRAPYSQLRAVGELLSQPLADGDLDDIQREIDTPFETRFAKQLAKLEQFKKLANKSPEPTPGE